LRSTAPNSQASKLVTIPSSLDVNTLTLAERSGNESSLSRVLVARSGCMEEVFAKQCALSTDPLSSSSRRRFHLFLVRLDVGDELSAQTMTNVKLLVARTTVVGLVFGLPCWARS